MKKHIAILMTIIIFTMIPLNTFADNINSEYLDVKVGSSREISGFITLTSDNGFNLYEKYDLGYEILQIDEDTIVVIANRDNWFDIMDLSNNLLASIPGDGSIVIGSGEYFESIVKVEANKYRDFITFLIKGNKIDIINHIDMEHYLYGVVPREIPASSPMEALKAQSVVARSYAYRNLNKHVKDGYDLCDTTHCQVYKAFDNEHPATNQAVSDTYGDYVTYNGNIVETPYHSTSGGYTESSVNSWGGNLPYLISVEDSFSSNSPNSSWKENISLSDMTSKLSAAGINVGEVLDFKLLTTTQANRVMDLKVVGSLGEQTILGTKLQTILGLKSRWFTIDKEGEGSSTTKVYVVDGNSIYPKEMDINSAYIIDGKSTTQVNRSAVSRAISIDRTSSIGSTYSTTPTSFVINGRGYGHGVGMSQYGAIEMAKQGYNYYDIITHYYTGVEVTNIGK